MLNRVPTVRRATTRVNIVPKKSNRIPSHLWLVTVIQYALEGERRINSDESEVKHQCTNLFSTSTRSLFSRKNRSDSPYALMVARPDRDSEK